jgi:hypothetical protein
MKETQAEFEIDQAGDTQNARVLAVLTASPGAWVAMPYLVEIGGGYAVHSRISDLRKAGHSIENLVDRSSKPYKSFYRLLP